MPVYASRADQVDKSTHVRLIGNKSKAGDNAKISAALVALLVTCCGRSGGAMAEGEAATIGTVKWSILDTTTSQVLSNGEKTLQIRDIAIRPIKDMYDKKIELDGHFNFSLVDSVAVPKTSGDGFGLTGGRNDQRTFSWDWFTVDRPGHATKLQDSGELSFDTKKTSNGIEIHRMEFLTDVSIRVCRESDAPLDPSWRIKIFKGSVICWPVLVNGEAQDQ